MRRSLLLPLSLLTALALTGCSGDEEAPQERPLPTLEAARNPELPVRPGDFCDRIDARAVAAAVGEEPTTAHYGNGERAELADGIVDVAHEFGCVFTAADGIRARAWVAVPPITPEQAARLSPGKGCHDEGDGLGEHGFAATCTTKRGTTATLAGLYTDTWFGCSLTEPEDAASDSPEQEALQERLGAWCASAVQAAATR